MNFDDKISSVKKEINTLKQRLDNLDDLLKTQEESINELFNNTQNIFYEATNNKTNSIQEIMKKAFLTGKLPGILSTEH